ncbi:nucleotidyltransferase family protein [Paenibacillus xylanilyticus]|uniref:nucleotidyltransferase domain-containing protein n=1 Tax=Paenibacillus xylanilyticus TaxID=248903 RepID=UPI003AAC57BC
MNHLNYDQLNNEERLILLTSKIALTSEEEKQVGTIIEEGFDVGRYTAIAVKHKVLQLSSRHVIRLDHKDKVNMQYKRLFEYNYLGNKEKNNMLFLELANLLRRFEEKGIKVIPVKGVILAPELYGNYGLRTLNDIDFIIRPDDRTKVSNALLEEGYDIGDYDWASQEIIPAKKEEALMWKMNAGNLHPHVKMFENPFLKCVRVDFSYDVDLQKDFQATQSLMQNAKESTLLGIKVNRLDPIDFLLHISIHLYKEASNVKWITMGEELSLIKFCDFREYLLSINEQLDWHMVYKRAQQLNAVSSMYYSLFFCNLLYRENYGNEFMANVQEMNIAEIDQFGQADYNRKVQWEKPFIERFFSDSNRDQLISGSKLDRYKQSLSTKS